MEPTDTMTSKLVLFALVLLAAVAGAECVRAGNWVGEDSQAAARASLTAAELDPVFTQKLADRVRGPYLRSHQATTTLARF